MPGTITGYLVDTIRLRAKRYIGHNPAGGAMVIALLAICVLMKPSTRLSQEACFGVKRKMNACKNNFNSFLIL